MKQFIATYLDPASRLGEILFGLIMVLTVTLSAGLAVTDDPTGVRQLLAAAIGCNVAWGIIDAVMYVMNCVTVRSGKVRLIEAIQRAPHTEAALALIEQEIEPELQELLDPEAAAAMNRSVLEHIEGARVRRTSLTKEDIYGAIACFWLVFVSCLPASLPFLLFSRAHFALRVSNGLLLVMLFLVGQKWAYYTGMSRMAAGSVMLAIGLALVGLAILLGG